MASEDIEYELNLSLEDVDTFQASHQHNVTTSSTNMFYYYI